MKILVIGGVDFINLHTVILKLGCQAVVFNRVVIVIQSKSGK